LNNDKDNPMALKKHRPLSNSQRHFASIDYRELSRGKPYKKLTRGTGEHSGRNNQGKITVRHRGAGNKRLMRAVDFIQDKFDVPGKIERIEYDPYRSSFIGLVLYNDGERRYIAVPENVKVGSAVISSRKKVDLTPGNRMPLKHIPTGLIVCQLELVPGKGAKIVRSAGNQAVVVAKEGEWVHIRLPSAEVRRFSKEAAATIGQMSNIDHANVRLGKAGRKRWLRWRPTVKGKNMNPVDHPHGGGEGHSPIGLVHPKTPWGKPALGVKTRQKNKPSDRMVVRPRRGRSSQVAT
jgi:large subunit ribosomal protein L2